MNELTDGLRLDGCKLELDLVPGMEVLEVSEDISSLGTGGGGRLVKGVDKDNPEALESARGRVLVSIVRSLESRFESLRARTLGTGGGPMMGGGGLVKEIL